MLDAAAASGAVRAQHDPVGWMRSWLGVDPWEKQVEIAESVRDHRRTAVKSCHGTGKSYLAARVVLWFLHAFPFSIVVTTAPTGRQVREILWRNVNAAAARARRPLLGRALQTRYDIAPDWYGIGFKATDADTSAFQGFHAEDILFVADEAAGVPDAVFEAGDSLLTSERAKLLMIGNPTSIGGRFHAAFHGARSLYNTVTVAWPDTPNAKAGRTVRPYLITQRFVDDLVAEEGRDSPNVRARIYAEFPEGGEFSLIPLSEIEAVNNRGPEDLGSGGGTVEAGLDVARFGGDENALCVRRGPLIEHLSAWTGLDTMETAGRVRTVLADFPDLAAIKVDVIGLGAGVADRLREQGYPVVDVNVATASSDPTAWPNLRHELWWGLRGLFRDGAIAGNGRLDERTIGQLADVRYRYDSRHTRPVIESKDDARKRRQRSPDRAEAVMLAFTSPPVRSAPIVAPIAIPRADPFGGPPDGDAPWAAGGEAPW